MSKLIYMIILSLVISGCQVLRPFGLGPSRLEVARDLYEDREYYKARNEVEKILKKDEDHEEAQMLMALILDKEIARHKELIAHEIIAEELTADEVRSEIRTWLERSETLFQRGQYDFALFAAEKVFIYDPAHAGASELIDEIKVKALKEGKADTLFVSKMYREEIAERIVSYGNLADVFLRDGRVNQARFTVEKVLLLEPENPQALKLLQDVVDLEEVLSR